jgi:hypothetical protein
LLVTLDELAETLPNGFHDARVSSMRLDFAMRVVELELSIWLGTDENPELHRTARVTLSGLRFCVLDPPDPTYAYMEAKPLWISDVIAPPSGTVLPSVDREAFVSSFFVNQWNAFVHVAAVDASLTWVSDDRAT